MNQKDRVIAEIIDFGKTSDYSEIVIDLTNRIYNEGFTLATNYDFSTPSLINWDKKVISIFMKKKPLFIIADMFHEYGHLLLGYKGNTLDTIEIELSAWNLAFKEMSKYDFLQEYINDLMKYQEECIENYRRNLKKPST